MSFTVTKVDIWSSKIEDKPGGLAKVLAALGDGERASSASLHDGIQQNPALALSFSLRQRELLSEKPRSRKVWHPPRT
jgi:hypothetical protein